MKELVEIQGLIKIAKDRTVPVPGTNKVKFRFWNAMDILAEAKPLAVERGCYIAITDDIVDFGGRLFVRATAGIYKCDGSQCVEKAGWAEIPDQSRGMDSCQSSGCASSYARKYALNGLFALNDIKDSDDYEAVGGFPSPARQPKPAPKAAPKPAPQEDGLPTSTRIFNTLVEAEAAGRLTKDGRQPREWFEKKYSATIPQMRLFDSAVEEARIRMQRTAQGEEFPSSPEADGIFDNA